MSRKPSGKLARLGALILGHDEDGPAAVPRTGIDPSSKRHFLALVIGTVAIMIFGITVALTWENDDPDPTPTVTVTSSPPSAE